MIQIYTSPKENYKLFIDELGTPSPKDITSNVYILSGCSINKRDCKDLKTWADQIKYKYWNRTDIILHSREIGRKENDFAIFKNKKVFHEFISDLEKFLLHSRFKMFFIVIDKKKALEAGWDSVKVHKDTTISLIRNFLLILLSGDSRGEIIIESSSVSKDIHILDSLNYFLGAGITKLNISYKDVQDTLTSISFVTKRNHDVEEQIADLFAYAAKIKYESIITNKKPEGEYEKMMLEVLCKKIFSVPKGAGLVKAKLFKEVEPFLVLP